VSRRPICFVTGASGALGPVVVREFLDAGFAVRALTRRPSDPALFPPGVEWISGDILQPETFRAALQGVDVVVHMAALLHVVDPPPSLAPEYERVNVQGTKNVVGAARDAAVRRVVFFSTIAVYGSGSASVLDESVSAQPSTQYAATKLEAERVAMSYRTTEGAPLSSVLRLAAVYGIGLKGNYRRLVEALAGRYFLRVGNGRNRRTLLYQRDAARAALLASTHPAAAGKTFNVTDGRTHTLNEIIEAISRALGRRNRDLSIPAVPARAAAGIIEDLFRMTGRRSPVGRATIDKLLEDVAVDGSRIIRELGFRPEYDLERGWAETIAVMRERGEI
jgi:nucleoside-diphosphate-sugar epimerase